MSVLKLMYELPRSGIFKFVNEEKKLVYISYSKNLITSLSRNIKEIQDKVHVYKPLNEDFEDWKFDIIETLNYHDTILDISCKINLYIEEYKQLGYNVRTHQNIQKLKFRVDIGQDYKVYCKLISRGRTEYVVGVFKDMEDAKEFIEMYRNIKNIVPIYSTNQLTKDYFGPQSQ